VKEHKMSQTLTSSLESQLAQNESEQKCLECGMGLFTQVSAGNDVISAMLNAAQARIAVLQTEAANLRAQIAKQPKGK
jgi:uncharacterized phage infection (PIP) family protein YhgE